MKRDEEEETKPPEEQELAGWVYSIPILFKRYGSHMLLGLSLVLLGFVLWHRYQANQLAKEDETWNKLAAAEATVMNPKPDVSPANELRTVANESEVPAVRAQAFLYLGKYLLDQVNAGRVTTEKLDTEEALKQAEAAYNKVLDESKDVPPFALEARMGLARIAEDRHEWDAATAAYTQASADATKAGYPKEAELAQEKVKEIETLKLPIALTPNPPTPTSLPGLPGTFIGPH